jgi:hypothetical protein
MSYARFGDHSDVYVFPHVGGGFECCACGLSKSVESVFTKGCKDHPIFGDIEPCDKCGGKGCEHCMMPDNTRLNTRSEMIAHLEEHKKAGDEVPEYAIERLKEEIKTKGETNDPLFDDGYDGPVAIDFKKGTISKLTDLKEN